MADSEGFEPSRRFPAYTLSRRAPSTTRPTVRGGLLIATGTKMQEGISCFDRNCDRGIADTVGQGGGEAGLDHMDILAAPFCPGLLHPKGHTIADLDIGHRIAPGGGPSRDAQGFRVFTPDHRTKIPSRIPDDNSSHCFAILLQ